MGGLGNRAMRYRLYLDTSVFGALFDSEDPQRVATTTQLLQRLRRPPFDAFVGTPLLEEITRAPERIRSELEAAIRRLQPTLLDEDETSLSLAEAYVGAGVVGVRHRDDARHLALASVAGLDTVVSWNFRHMVNLAKKRLVHSVNVRLGYHLIDCLAPGGAKWLEHESRKSGTTRPWSGSTARVKRTTTRRRVSH